MITRFLIAAVVAFVLAATLLPLYGLIVAGCAGGGAALVLGIVLGAISA